MQRLQDLPLVYRLVLYASLALAASVATSMTIAFLKPGIDPSLADKDFANYWMAGRLIHEGRVLDLFGPQPVYFAHLRAAFGADFPWHAWSYPPHYLLFVWPLGLFSYKGAALVFLIGSGTAFVLAYRAYVNEDRVLVKGGSALAWIAIAPLLLLNLWCMQNGYLSGALFLGALVLRDKRPILAGILLGALTIKPQLGVLLPFLLIAEKRWLMIISASATTGLLVATSVAVFGSGAWQGFFEHVLPYQTSVMTKLDGLFLSMLPSTFGALRNLGATWELALGVHWLVAIPVALISIFAFFRITDMQGRSNILLIATFIVTPYALNYDLAGFAAAVAVLALRDCLKPRRRSITPVFLALAMVLPVLMVVSNLVGITIAPVVLPGAWIIALRQGGFAFRANDRGPILRQRTPRPTDFTAPAPASSPASASD